MTERKLGIVSGCLKGGSPEHNFPLMAKAGFNCYFTGAYTLEDAKRVLAAGDAVGMTCESIHAPFGKINSMWLPGMDYRKVYLEMKESISTAAALNVPVVVIHLSSGWYAPVVNDLGLERYDALVEYAAEKGVTVAFENLRKIGNLACIMDRYEAMPNVGYCLDFGHELCYTPNISWMDLFQNRLVATHIHDNHGISKPFEEATDEHLLPFEGKLDYENVMRKLNRYDYTGSLILENTNHLYQHLSEEDFLATAYERLARIAQMGQGEETK